MRRLLPALVLLGLMAPTLASLPACAAPETPTQAQLRQNRERWAGQGITSYRYRLQVSCFCPPEITRPVVIEVRNDRPGQPVYVDTGLPVTTDYFQRYDTIIELFDAIQDAITRQVDELTVRYDGALGYPSSISIDVEKMAADDETVLTVSGFERMD